MLATTAPADTTRPVTTPRAAGSDTAASGTAAVLVVYGTAPARLRRTLRALAGSLRIVVDNSETEDERRRLAAVCAEEGVLYEGMSGNAGVGAAQHRGIEVAERLGARLVLLADDDTDLDRHHVLELERALYERMREDPRVAGIGPMLVDERSREAMYFVWRRALVRFVRLPEEAVQPTHPFPAAFLIASGSLLRLDAYAEIGPFRADYFIDHIDREWGLRAGARGWALLVHPGVRVRHALGDAPRIEQDGTATYRHESPLRHYYGSRNSLLLVRDVRLPLPRRVLEAAMAAYVVGTQWRAHGPVVRRRILAGVLDGLRGRRGKAPVG